MWTRRLQGLNWQTACAALLLVATGYSYLLAEEDAYEKRITDDFIENTVFRFRTKFNRTYIDTPAGEFKTLISRKIEVPPIIDGILEDPCWKIADQTKSAFSPRTQKTVARKQSVGYVCHDDNNLYFAIVNEEPSLKGVRMSSHHPADRKSWTTSGMGDCIEQFIELGGVGGTGQVFQFIYNIYPEVAYDGLFPPYVPFIETGFKLKGSFGAKRWIVEIAFPCKGFNTEKTSRVDFRYEGPPRRGEVWGLRLMRFGPKFGQEVHRFNSSWTYNPTPTTNHIPFPTGIIVFEDRNALRNGKMNEVNPKTGRPRHWTLAKVGKQAEGSLVFDEEAGHAIFSAKAEEAGEGVQITQGFGVMPSVSYRLMFRVKKLEGDGKLVLGVERPHSEHEITENGEWVSEDIDFYAEPFGRESSMFIRALGGSVKAAIDEIRVEQQIYGPPPGATCLTGNSPRVDLNLGPEKLKLVKYTYRKPGTDEERFPFRKRWSHGWVNGVPDAGGTQGWIPATEGTLTKLDLQQVKVEWTHPRPGGAQIAKYHSHDLIFDLGREYYIRSVELLPLAMIGNLTASIKTEKSDYFVLSRKLRGAGVLNPPSAVLYGKLGRIDSVGRYVKVNFSPGGQYGHGIYFVRIWGEETKGRTGIKRFRWKEGLVVPEVKHKQFRKLEGPVLMPTPQEVEWGDGEFIVRDGTPVYYGELGRGESTMQCLVEEVEKALGIRLRPVLETGREAAAQARGAIVLGDASVASNGFAARLAKERGWSLTDKRPGAQGYFLSARPDGILVCGLDQAGAFYGVQTLLQLLVRKDYESAGARSVEVRDWPYIPLRMIDVRGPGAPTKPFIRALVRMKANVIKSNLGRGEMRKFCDDHFIFAPEVGAGHSGGGPIEMNDDENWYHLGTGPAGYMRINACPSHLKKYEFYNNRARIAAYQAGITDIDINTDEMDGGGAGSGGGARWHADRRCLDRKMTGDGLFTEMVLRAYDLCRGHGRNMAMIDTMLVASFEGGRGSYHDMYKAYDRIPEDIHIYAWRGFVDHTASNPEEGLRRFHRVTLLQGRLPFHHRGKVNQGYKVPEGKRAWGVWSTVWGIAGPVDQILAGQFCRSMGSVDGGCIIPFMCNAWNPDSPAVHSLDWVLRIGHFQQRLGEIALERELPSWRDGVPKEFFKVDMRAACNWSHIDPVPGDGKDWLDWGPNNDLSRLPRGDVVFEEVPFHVIDPKTNGGKSIMVIARQPSNPRLKFPSVSPEIPIGRQAAGLVLLRANLGGGHHPGHRVTYENGRYLTIPFDAMGNASDGYACYGAYAPGRPSGAPDDPYANFKSAKHRMSELFSLFFRVAWIGTTPCGDPLKVTMHEWVNPYPELTIKSISVAIPPGRQSGRREVLFAITGIAPVQRDLDLWKDRRPLPLVMPNEVEIEPGDVPVIPEDGQWGETETGKQPTAYSDSEGNPVCTVSGFFPVHGFNNANFFKRRDRSWLRSGGTIKLAKPQVCKKVALRGQFYWRSFSVKPHYGVTRFQRTDYIVEVSADGKTWTKIGEKKGICAEDGDHVHRLSARPIQYVRVQLDGDPYLTPRSWRFSSGPGLCWLQLYK